MHLAALEQGQDIVFLHHIEAGPASKSYGIAVAKLAGLPPRALKSAQKHLALLENQASNQRPQLDIFHTYPNNETPPTLEPHPVLATLAQLNPDHLSPREALNCLYQLKQLSET